MQKEEDDHGKEVICHEQKVQHHEYEHNEALNDIKQSGDSYMLKEEDKHGEIETANRKQKVEIKDEYERNEKSHIAEVTQKETELKGLLGSLDKELEENKKRLIATYEQKLRDLEAELNLRMKVEIHEIEERKNQHINDLMINHENAFREMKQYYNDITKENLDIIKQLQEKFQDVKTQILNSEVVVGDLKASV